MKWTITACLAALALVASPQAQAQVRITEWMYNGNGTGDIGEFVELTNMGLVAVNLNDWSFDDISRAPNSFDISPLGILDPGESAIITDLSEAAFRANWNLPLSVAVAGGNTHNLGRTDEINIYNAADMLIDRLTYSDQAMGDSTPGGPRTNGASGNPLNATVLGDNTDNQWIRSNGNGDPYGSYFSAVGEQGNPGYFVPEPACLGLGAIGLLGILGSRRRG